MSYVDYFAGAIPNWAPEAARSNGVRAATQSEIVIEPAPAAASGEQRQHPRRPLDQHRIQVVCSYGVLPAEMLDLSLTGAKLRLLSGLGPNAGEDITIRLGDGAERQGAVAWIDHMTLGISLKRPLPRALD